MTIPYSFLNDYAEGAHPRLLDALARSNMSQELGYGEDQYSLEAAQRIREASAAPEADVHFVSGGTQANQIFLASCLRPFESVIAVESGHIYVHEAGAIEATGHKVHNVAGRQGKIGAAEIEGVAAAHTDEHMVRPRAVYISHSTEVGTIYSAGELAEISAACRARGLFLYVDGARLGAALTARTADLDLPGLSRLADAFYIGGTKNGALLGEALVINHPALKPDFRFHIKQRGGLLSKGRIMGVQFLELFKDGLFFELARHANAMAEKLAAGIAAQGYAFQSDSPTNQIFPIFPDWLIAELNRDFRFYTWARVDGEHSAVRLVTSWATPEGAVEGFLEALGRGKRR